MPKVTNVGNMGGIAIVHREFIKDIVPLQGGVFNIETFPLNPGLPATFPWLSQVSDAFEQYKWKGLVFEYKSTCSSLVTGANGTGLGTVIMATNYNAMQQPFTDKRSMENYEFACSSAPTTTFPHAVECAKGVTPVTELYVRTGQAVNNEDLRLYDLGHFNIATIGCQNPVVGGRNAIGELWVTYEVEFFKPKYRGAQGSHLLGDHFIGTNDNIIAPTVANPFGQAPLWNKITPPLSVANPRNGYFVLGCTIQAQAGGSLITFPDFIADMVFHVSCLWTNNPKATANISTTFWPEMVWNIPVNSPMELVPAFNDGAGGDAYTAPVRSNAAAGMNQTSVCSSSVVVHALTKTDQPFTINVRTATGGWENWQAAGILDVYITQVNRALFDRNFNQIV